MRRFGSAMMILCLLAGSGCAGTGEKTSLLFVQLAESATLRRVNNADNEYELELGGLHPHVVYFTDRPQRQTGSISTEQLLARWDQGRDSFANDPPNAALSMEDRQAVLVMEISHPIRAGSTLRYTATMLDDPVPAPDIAGDLGPVALFIDNLGTLPDPMNTPDSFGLGGGYRMNGLRGSGDPMNRPDNFGR